jgi:hypothetical protein
MILSVVALKRSWMHQAEDVFMSDYTAEVHENVFAEPCVRFCNDMMVNCLSDSDLEEAN